MFPLLLTSDLHLTSNPMDEYRWGVFESLKTIVKSERVEMVAILGDLTDAKDNHASTLVNRTVDTLARLGEVAEVVVMMGNHDYLKEGHPFFGFVSRLPNVRFISEPTVIGRSLFVPHTKHFGSVLSKYFFDHYDFVFIHQTVNGAVASNGMALQSELTAAQLQASARGARIYSGDIHVPQKVGNVEYVGSPYHVHFGDNFQPRMLLLRSPNAKHEAFKYDTISRFTRRVRSVEELFGLTSSPGDQVKVKLEIRSEDATKWAEFKTQVKAWAKDNGVVLCGLELDIANKRALSIGAEKQHITASRRSPKEVVEVFADHERLSDEILNVGLELVR